MALRRTTTKPGTSRHTMRERPRAIRAWPRRWAYAFVALLASVVALWMAACSAGGSSNDDDDDGSAASGGVGGGLNLGGDNEGGGLAPDQAYFQGKVLAPEGTIPISGALVYATQTMPDAIPDRVYCQRCVDLPPHVRYVLTEPDGTFTLGVPGLGDWYLVVQKGSFRRIRGVYVGNQGETVQVGPDVTTLPAQDDPAAGDTIPNIAVSYGSYDHIQDSLQKLGLQADVAFDIYEEMGYPPGADLLLQPDLLESYHIVFFPCTTSWPNNHLSNQTVLDNLRTFVNKGGRLYVTDWTYDMLRRVFEPESPLAWRYDNGSYDDAQYDDWGDLVSYDAPATATDTGLAAWLAAQGIVNFTAEANWTIIDHTSTYNAPDEDANMTSFDPTVWVTGQVPSEGTLPCTTSFQYGCGRALFSTYHTEAGWAQLMPQELALLYIILEIGVCVGDYPPPR